MVQDASLLPVVKHKHTCVHFRPTGSNVVLQCQVQTHLQGIQERNKMCCSLGHQIYTASVVSEILIAVMGMSK